MADPVPSPLPAIPPARPLPPTGIRPPVNPSNPLNALLLEASGFHHTPGARLIPVRPSPLILSWLAPQPVGVVPPRYYGLPDDYFFGMTPHEVIDLATGQTAATAQQQRRAARELLPLTEQLLALRQRSEFIPTVEAELARDLAAQIAAARAGNPIAARELPDVRSIEAELRLEVRDRRALAAGLSAVAPLLPAEALPIPAPLAPAGVFAPVPLLPQPTQSSDADPTSTPPVHTDAQNAAGGARPPMRDLMTERADP